MAVRILHFGRDDCYRVTVLQRVGYTVSTAENLEILDLRLRQPDPVDAVVISEDDPETAEHAAEVVRRRSAAPVILFRRSKRDLDESKFGQVFPWNVPPEVWLAETGILIEKSQSVRDVNTRAYLELDVP